MTPSIARRKKRQSFSKVTNQVQISDGGGHKSLAVQVGSAKVVCFPSGSPPASLIHCPLATSTHSRDLPLRPFSSPSGMNIDLLLCIFPLATFTTFKTFSSRPSCNQVYKDISQSNHKWREERHSNHLRLRVQSNQESYLSLRAGLASVLHCRMCYIAKISQSSLSCPLLLQS